MAEEFVLTLLLLAVVSAGMRAQTAAAAAPNAPEELKPEDRCTVEGNVYSAHTGEPLKNALIRLIPAATSVQEVYGAMTDAAGHYVVTDLPPGSYHVGAQRNGFVQIGYGQGYSPSPGRLLNLAKGQRVTDLNFRMQPQAVVTGRVVDEDNEPMANVSVRLMRYRYREGARTLSGEYGDATDDRGEYRVHGVLPGQYYVVAIFNGSRFQQQPVITKDRQGSYLPVYYPSSVGQLAGASQITATGGMETQGIDFRLKRVRTIRISGKMSNPEAGATVWLMPSDDSGALTREMIKRQRTDIRGRFVFEDVMPGSYTLFTHYGGETAQVASVPVDVGETNLDGIVLTPVTPPQVSGSINAEAVEMNGLGVRVVLQPLGNQITGRGAAGVLSENGTFVLPGVVPGRYRVRLGPLPDGAYLKSVVVGQTEAPEGIVDFSHGAAGDLALTVSGKAGEVDGLVRNRDAAAPASRVVLIPDQPENYSEYKSTFTDQNGNFSIRGIRPGNYKLFAWDQVENDAWTDPDYLQPFEGKGEVAVVREGDKLTKELKLIVTAADGEAPPNGAPAR